MPLIHIFNWDYIHMSELVAFPNFPFNPGSTKIRINELALPTFSRGVHTHMTNNVAPYPSFQYLGGGYTRTYQTNGQIRNLQETVQGFTKPCWMTGKYVSLGLADKKWHMWFPHKASQSSARRVATLI